MEQFKYLGTTLIYENYIQVEIKSRLMRVSKSRIMRLVGYVARMKERRDVYRVLVRKRDEKRQLGRPRRRWEDNIKMFIREVMVRNLLD